VTQFLFYTILILAAMAAGKSFVPGRQRSRFRFDLPVVIGMKRIPVLAKKTILPRKRN
jgi:hypothetical protein